MQIRTREKFIKYINRAATMPSGRRSFTPYILVDVIIDIYNGERRRTGSYGDRRGL